MKRYFLHLILVFLVSAGTVFGQNIIISDHGNTIPNGGDVFVWGDYNNLIEVHLSVTNNSSSALDIKVKKIEQNIVSGSVNYFCWTECYSPYVFLTPDSIRFPAGYTDSVSFIGDYMPMGNAGVTIVTYVFFNNDDINDSTAVNIHYNGSPTSVPSVGVKKVSLANAFPNPAQNSVSFEYKLPADAISARIIIRDMVGSVVRQKELNSQSGKAIFNIEELSPGVYFYSLIVNGEAFATRKLIVNR